MSYNRKDAYYHQAKKEGYKSRAAYKLMELNKKASIIKQGSSVLDCGAAPGGWCQVALKLVGKTGRVVAVDYEVITGINEPNFTFIPGNMLEQETIDKILVQGFFDVVLSDMAPKTTGVKLKDHVDSMELAGVALATAEKVLKKGGAFIVKLFDGEDRPAFLKLLQSKFSKVRSIRPDATRKNSYEIYVIASGYKG